MKKRLITILLAVITAMCLIALAGCDKGNTPPEPQESTFAVTVQASENGNVTASAATVEKGGSVTFTISPATGYVLDEFKINGEAVDVNGTTHTVENVQTDLTAAATFKKQTVTVNFQNATPSSATVNVGEPYGEALPAMVSTPGNRFVGWFTGENGSGTRVTATTIVTQTTEHTLYPHFTDKIVVTFDYGAGSGREDIREVAHNTAIGELPTVQPPVNGALYGWFIDNAEIDATYEITEDVTVRASFITATVTLKAGSTVNAFGGMSTGNIEPELEVSVMIDGSASDETVDLVATDPEIATVTDGKVTALKDGSVKIKAMFGGVELSRTDFDIVCRSYADYTAVTTKAELMAIGADETSRAGKYYIANDISMTGDALWKDWQPVFGIFTGVIDGMGHKIYDCGGFPAGWDQGAFTEMRGTVRDLAVELRTLDGAVANNGFFGKLKGTVENVFLKISYKHSGQADSASGWGALASYIEENGKLINCVVDLDKASDADYAAGIAVNAANFLGEVKNVFIIKNGAILTENYDGLYYKSAAADGLTVAEAITTNSAAFDYLVQLINSTEVDVSALGAAWEIKDGALFFHGKQAIAATPEYVIMPSGNVAEMFEEAQSVQYSVRLIHNGVETTEIPENIRIVSSDPTVAELVYDEDYGFILNYKTQGLTTITISIGENSASFNVDLKFEAHIKTAQEFLDKIAANPAGIFVLDNDIDFENEEVQAWAYHENANFTGSIDGRGHVVKNARLKGSWNGGLISYFDGTIRNIGFVNFSMDNAALEGGIFELIHNGAIVENVFIDWVVTGNPGGRYGALGAEVVNCTVSDLVIVVRPSADIDPATIDKFGLVAGILAHNNAVVSHVRALAVGFDWDSADLFTTERADSASVNDCAAYVDYAGLLASDLTAFDGEYWTIDATGITFGENKVFEIE